MPDKKPRGLNGGRYPVPRAPDEDVVKTSVILRESDITYLQTINPKNISAAIRELIRRAQSS